MSALRPLPDFERPPVVELVLDIQFQPIRGLDVPRLGLLWQAFRADFPRVEQQGPAHPLIERFGPAAPEEVELVIERFATIPLPRLWFLDSKGSELIQVQSNRFIHNWRRLEREDIYPRYENVRDRFSDELRRFEAFLEQEQLGSPVPELCEITYFNHVEAGSKWQHHGELHQVLRLWKPDFGESFLARRQVEATAVSFQLLMKNDDGNAFGRWRVSVQPGYARNGEVPIFVITNTARGRPLGEGIDGALRFLDLGHDWTVRGFAAITTDTMHQVWGRTDGS